MFIRVICIADDPELFVVSTTNKPDEELSFRILATRAEREFSMKFDRFLFIGNHTSDAPHVYLDTSREDLMEGGSKDA